jgi:hypothetical protein
MVVRAFARPRPTLYAPGLYAHPRFKEDERGINFLADSAVLLLTEDSVEMQVSSRAERRRPDSSVILWYLPTWARSIVFAALNVCMSSASRRVYCICGPD